MAKPKIKVKKTFSYKKLAKEFPQLTANMLNLKGGMIHDAIQNGIDLQEDIDGNKYIPMSDYTKAMREKKGIKGKKLLHITGDMRKTKPTKATTSKLKYELKSLTPYAAEHNEGDASQNLPQRKWFGIPKSTKPGKPDAKKLDLLWGEALRHAWKKHGG